MLRSVIPDRTTFELADRMFRDAWDKRSGTAKEESKRLRTKSRQIERESSAFVERSVQTKNAAVIEAIENKIAELQSEKVKIDEVAAKTACPTRTFDEMFELAMRFLSSPYDIWEKGDLVSKRTVLRLVFSQPLALNLKEGIRTPETTFPFKVLRFLSSSDCKMAPPHGCDPLQLLLFYTRLSTPLRGFCVVVV